jgi:hypothetical protein
MREASVVRYDRGLTDDSRGGGTAAGVERKKEETDRTDRGKRVILPPEKSLQDVSAKEHSSGKRPDGETTSTHTRRRCDYADFGVTSGTIQRGQLERPCGIVITGEISP